MHKVLFILNYGQNLGLGHLSRCSIIAKCYKENGISTHLLTKSCSSPEDEKLNAFNFLHFYNENYLIKEFLDLYKNHLFSTIVIDDYLIDYKKIISNVESHTKVLRFDLEPDLQDKSSITINYNPCYKNNDINHLIGPDYILIDNKFKNLQRKLTNDEVFVFFGGGDDYSAIDKFSDYLNFLSSRHSRVNIAITKLYKNKEAIIKKYKSNSSFNVLIDSENYPEILNNCMFALTSGGTITYESAFLEIPMQIVSVADNQVKQSQAWDEHNNAKYVGSVQSVDSMMLKNSYKQFFSDQNEINKWFKRKSIMVDGYGAERIMNHTTG